MHISSYNFKKGVYGAAKQRRKKTCCQTLTANTEPKESYVCLYTGESRYIVSRYLYAVIFLYPVPVILPFSLLPYWSIENCTERGYLRYLSYFWVTRLYIFFSKQRCIHRNSTWNLQLNVSTQV